MKNYFGVHGTGVQLTEPTKDKKNSLLKEKLDRYGIIVEDECDNTLYDIDDFYDEFYNVESDSYITRAQTLNCCSGVGHLFLLL